MSQASLLTLVLIAQTGVIAYLWIRVEVLSATLDLLATHLERKARGDS